MLLTGQATKRLPKSKVTSSREPPAPARACAGQRRRDTRGGGTVGDQQGQEGASRRLRRRSRRTTAPKDGPGHPTLACDDGPSAMHSSRHSAPRKPSRGLTLQLSLTSSSSGPLSSSSSSSLRRWEQQRRFSPRVSEVAQKTAAKPQYRRNAPYSPDAILPESSVGLSVGSVFPRAHFPKTPPSGMRSTLDLGNFATNCCLHYPLLLQN